MVRKTRGWGVNFWASENWSGRVHFEGHSPEWQVLSKLSVQPCCGIQKHSNSQAQQNKTHQINDKTILLLGSIVKTNDQSLTSLALMQLIPGADQVVRHICIWCITKQRGCLAHAAGQFVSS